MMRLSFASAISCVSALSVLQGKGTVEKPKYVAPIVEIPDTPIGIADDPEDKQVDLVHCEDDAAVPVPMKRIFAAMMGCNRDFMKEAGGEAGPLCDNFAEGGCDSQDCHNFCHEMYESTKAYMKCTCSNWGTAKSFKEHSPGAAQGSCPLKVQPRCLNGDLYRSECEALGANPNVSAGDLEVRSVSAWPKGDNNLAIKVVEGGC